MMSGNDRERLGELLALLRGERAGEGGDGLRRRLAADPELRAEYARLEAAWAALGADPAVAPRPGFATAVVASARAEGRGGGMVPWSLAPAWARAVAVLALLGGAAVGSSVMALGTAPSTATAPGTAVAQAASPAAADELGLGGQTTLADDYAEALQSGSGLDDEVLR